MNCNYWLLSIGLLVGMVFVNCGDDDPATDAGGGTPDATTDTGGDADAAVSLTIDTLLITENPKNRLAAIIELETSVETTATISVENVDTSDITTIGPTAAAATTHDLAVLGLWAETDYSISITVEDNEGNTTTSEAQSYTTGSLPDDFPPITVVTADTDNVSEGYTLVNLNRWNPSLDQNYGYLIVFDESGRVVWYFRTGIPAGDVQLRDDGTILYIGGVNAGFEIDWLGEQTGFWFPPNVGMESIHHFLDELPNGNLWAVGTERRVIDGYATADGGTTSYNVIGDTINEFTHDGTEVDSWTMFDYLDPLDVPADLDDPFYTSFDDPFWDFLYDGNTKDWTHVNNVEVDPSDGFFIVSCRHLDLIFKFDPDDEDHEVIWELGHDRDFTMLGDGEWQYHQHSPELQDNGNFLIYDNGNNRPGLAEGENYFTRVVEFAIDTDAMTAEEVWEYRGEEPYFASYVGDANRLENGNVLIIDGGILSDPTATETDPDNGRWGRIVEVTHTEPVEVVLMIEVRDTSDSPMGYQMSRATRFSSFYE